jgi:DNA (cytosine-5)-methyltransferase 1
MNELRIGELFCGPGGIAFGAELANKAISKYSSKKIKHAWAVDYHESTIETYIKNIKGATAKSALCHDVRLPNLLENLKNISDIDGFAYGFPCNDFSLVGEQKGFNGKFGPLYKFGIDVLHLFNPSFFIAENVSGIRGANQGGALKKIIDDLSKAGEGYDITAHLYKFEEYGVPQTRHRVILVGFRKDLMLKFKPPAPTHLKKFNTSYSAIMTPAIKSDAFNNELTKQHPRVIERLKCINPGQNAWTANIPENLKLNVSGATISQIYKRLDPNKPSYTVTGSGGGGTHVYHWAENRALTNRERARLQTFPDNFVFHGNKEDVRRQIGMAVPPLGAKILFEAIIKTLEGIHYEFVQSNLS